MKFQIALILPVALLTTILGCNPADQGDIRDARSAAGLAFDLVGEGPLVVLIHGSNLDRRMWEAEVAWLREDTRVLTYDLRGQGESVDPVEPYSNHADLLALLDEVGEREASLIGLSAGAQVALDLALVAPHRVRGLVLVSPSLHGYVPEAMPPFLADLSEALRDGAFERANEVLLASSLMSVPPRFADAVRTMVQDNARLWTIPYSLVEQVQPPAIQRLATVQTPTLILVGENDLEAILAQSRLLAQQLAHVRLVSIPGGGHLLNMTSPEAFRSAVASFLRPLAD
jgi:pimeloyl-ACP methyl ester carboxylesterase